MFICVRNLVKPGIKAFDGLSILSFFNVQKKLVKNTNSEPERVFKEFIAAQCGVYFINVDIVNKTAVNS